jgi:hypothetical protein
MQAQLTAQRTAIEPPAPAHAPQTAPGHDDAAALRPSAVPVQSGHAPRRCSCGGIVGPTGECSACRARRLLAEAGTDVQDKAAALVAPLALGVDGAWLGRQLGSGSKLAPDVQREMEDAFGVDFAHVRIHTDPRARSTARRLNAEAFSVGPHVVFGDHAYSPDTREGRLLLRHELAHVVQQRAVSGIPSGVLRLAQPAERSEREARAFARDGSSHRAARVTLSSVGVAQVNRTSLCEIGCDAVAWGATAALVAAVAAGCTAGSVVTFGGLAIPCTAAVIGTAAIGAVDAVLWGAILKQAICGIPITVHTPPQQASAAPTPGAGSDGAGAAPAASAPATANA